MKKTSRILSLLLALCLCMALLPATALAAGNFSIDSKNVLTKYNGPGGHVTIPDGVTAIGRLAFADRNDVTSVTIPDTVTGIGWHAFYECTGLTSIEIPSSVTYIDHSAFYRCTELTSVIIPDTVKSIGIEAFYGCTSLVSVTLGSGLERVSADAFSGCTSLASVEIKNGLKEIPMWMFTNCSSLTSIELPDSVKTIGMDAFYGCQKLSHVDLGTGVQSIAAYAFARCSSLKEITLPASLTELSSSAFSSSYFNDTKDTMLETITYAEGTKILPGDGSTRPTLTRVNVPASVTAVKDGTFDNQSNLTVYGVSGSYMESWCALRGIPFVGSEPVIPEPTFTDVADNAYYAAPVNWAVEKKITSGTSKTAFSPDATCTRGQIVTFLHRAYAD